MRKTTSPTLRFPGFANPWQSIKIVDAAIKVSTPVKVNPTSSYKQIGIKSHGKGIFYKDSVSGKELGSKRVFWVQEDVFILNIVFAWEQAIARTTKNEIGMVASHRFPMFKPKSSILNLDFILYYFLTDKGKALLEAASPGGAGRNKTLGQKSFENLKINLPTLPEQIKISDFLVAVDDLLLKLNERKSLLAQYKTGVMHQIFEQRIRFTKDNGETYPDWKSGKLSDYLIEHKVRNRSGNHKEVFSVAKEKGVINQIEHLGRSYASLNTTNYKVVFPHDVIYTKSPTSDFPFGIIKQNKTGREGIVSVLYGVFKPINKNIGALLHLYFLSPKNTYNYLNPLVHKGAKNTMNIGNNAFLNGAEIILPTSLEEQQKIIDFIVAIDEKIEIVEERIISCQNFKKGLLQQMFV
jgi:type I restriction enzyme S subunit